MSKYNYELGSSRPKPESLESECSWSGLQSLQSEATQNIHFSLFLTISLLSSHINLPPTTFLITPCPFHTSTIPLLFKTYYHSTLEITLTIKMTDAVRRRRSILQLAADTKNIKHYKLGIDAFKTPIGVPTHPELQAAMEHLGKRAIHAISAMAEFRNLRNNRYNALCPVISGYIYELHASSMKLLLQWREDWAPTDPSLAPSAKIPREALSFYFDPNHYAKWTSWYITQIEEYMSGPFSAYRACLTNVEFMAARLLNELDYKIWRSWWDSTFKPEMFKWESCLEGLIMPTYEEVIDDIYLMVIDRVENAEDLVNMLNASHWQTGYPQTEQNQVQTQVTNNIATGAANQSFAIVGQ